MGTVVSSLSHAVKGVKTVVQIFRELYSDYTRLVERANTAPGYPVAGPTESFWLENPPYPELVDIQSDELPERADIVVIGSGITGAAVARSILHECRRAGESRTVVVVEARQLCSGATGRNGGHIKPSPYSVLDALMKKLPGERAAALVRFQLMHLKHLTELCREDKIDVAECREVETVDFYMHEEKFQEASKQVEELRRWVPEFEIHVWTRQEAKEKFLCNGHVVGAISYAAGALWPYRFVTSIWKALLDEFPKQLSIETDTAVYSVDVDDADVSSARLQSAAYPYKIATNRGTIHAAHVVHATNAFVSQHIPRLRGKVAGVLAHMSAQRPGKQFPDLDGRRSWSFIYGVGFDYVTQRPTVNGAPGEVMVGGGFAQSETQGLENVAVYDDSKLTALTVAHLEGIMPTLFSPNWGEEGEGGRMKKVWSGIIAVAPDMLPLVGRLDHRTTGRRVTTQRSSGTITGTNQDTGEWISAAYIGDGMAWAWLCGVALGIMIVGRQQEELSPQPGRPGGAVAEWFPPELYATHERIKKLDIADLAEEVM